MKVTSTISPSVKYGLHFIGVWPGTPFPMFHKIYWILFLALFQTYAYKYIIQHFQSASLVETIDNICITLAFTQTNIKLIIAWINQDVLCKLLSTMEEGCKKYASMDTNNLLLKTAGFSYRLTTTIVTLYALSAVFHVAGTAASLSSIEVNESLPLLLKMDLPFETNTSPTYELLVIAQFLHQTSCAFSFGVFSALVLMVILHAGYQIDIMCQTIMDVSLQDKEQLKLFIIRHQDVIVFTERIEKYFTYIALSQLLFNTLTTCCLGFLIVISVSAGGGIPLLIKSLLFYIVMWMEAYTYCFAGEYLSAKSQMICETAYKCLWYDLHPNDSQLLIPVILRSQKGFTFTFGKFSRLSFENFTSIMRASASYMSVLLAMS